MIGLSDTEDRAALRELARRVARDAVAPYAQSHDRAETFVEEAYEALRKAELFGITIGEAYGGMGQGDIEAAIVLEEIARVDVSSAILCQLVYNGPPRAIEHLGSDALRRRWLPEAARGELFCIGITEPDAGSAATSMRARLVPDGDGFRLHAYKNYVTGGHRAIACLVWCRFPPEHDEPAPRNATPDGSPATRSSDELSPGTEAPRDTSFHTPSPAGSSRPVGSGTSRPAGAKGIGAVLVDLSLPGVSVAGTHKKMGLRGCTEAELAFDGVRIEPGDVLVWGDPTTNAGLKTLLSHLNHERCGNAAMCLGAAQGALEYAISYVGDRLVGQKRLAELQGIQWKLADCATELEGARLLLARALALAGGARGTPPAMWSAMAKLACNLAAKHVTDEAIQMLGGYGYSSEYPLERAYRDVRGLCIGAGTVEIQRNLIASGLTGGHPPDAPWWQA